jgi:hypothetical protein
MRSKTHVDIKVNKIHDIKGETFRDIVKDIPSRDEGGASMRGLCFYKAKSGTRLIYNYKSNKNDFLTGNRSNIVTKTVNTGPKNTDTIISTGNGNTIDINNIQNTTRKLVNTYYMLKPELEEDGEELIATLRVETTSLSDVYNVYVYERVGKKRIKYVKMDIAYIANQEKSKWIRERFIEEDSVVTKGKVQYLFMKCKWNTLCNKWEPFEVNETARLPTSFAKISEKLMLVEESDSDSDFD